MIPGKTRRTAVTIFSFSSGGMVLVARILPMIWAPLLASLRTSMRVRSAGEVKIEERREDEAAGSEVWEMTMGSDLVHRQYGQYGVGE